MLKNNLGYPRIGNNRELKKASERYWSGKASKEDLLATGSAIRLENWKAQQEEGIDLIPSNDFSNYDQVLDWALTVGAIPERYQSLREQPLDLYFAMARGRQQDGFDVPAMEMTKWFDTNYHYIVPEFMKDQTFSYFNSKPVDEFKEALEKGITTKPVLLGPVSFLLLGKEKEPGFHKLDLLERLLPVYIEIIGQLVNAGAEWIQFDEPCLATDIDAKAKKAYQKAYTDIKKAYPGLKSLLATYFDGLHDNAEDVAALPVCAIHLDLVRAPEQLEQLMPLLSDKTTLSLGVINGRNVWINDYQKSLDVIEYARKELGGDRLMIAPSCSLLHVPYDVNNEKELDEELVSWLSFARQKLREIGDLHAIAAEGKRTLLERNQSVIAKRAASDRIHKEAVKQRVGKLQEADGRRKSPFSERNTLQKEKLQLPLLPTTTIGSFPQTKEVRKLRADLKKGTISEQEYTSAIRELTEDCIRRQEEIGLDVLVHGEYERNDMVEYFGEKLDGFAFTKFGWVQSYGSRCVKPPVIYGDVSRPEAMTVEWIRYAQSLTDKPVKGMLTGPLTILQWSFVRDDQPRKDTCLQIALSILDEVKDLEAAGTSIIQVDEPAMREGLPLRQHKHRAYLDWAIYAFRVASSDVRDETQIHTHMCYSEFNDIIEDIAAMDADVITIETSRSQMELLDAFEHFNYPNEIGPGVYDIHSPRIPPKEEIIHLLHKAMDKIPIEHLWVNPDCGLKTRNWETATKSLKSMVEAAKSVRREKEVLV